jgi:hypothetical protein
VINNDNFSPDQALAAGIWLVKNTELKPIDIVSLVPSLHEFQVILIKSGTCTFDVEEFNPIEEGMIPKITVDAILNRYKLKPVPRTTKRYIPKPLREHIPGAITWLHYHYPDISPKDIGYAFGTTTKRVKEVINTEGIYPLHPVACQLLNDAGFEELIRLSKL